MSLLNSIQPGHSSLPSNSFKYHIPHRLAPCAKAISILLLILSNNAAWASVDIGKKESEQLAQMRKMARHYTHLENEANQERLHPNQSQKEKLEYLQKQSHQQREQLNKMYPKWEEKINKEQKQKYWDQYDQEQAVQEKTTKTKKPLPTKVPVKTGNAPQATKPKLPAPKITAKAKPVAKPVVKPVAKPAPMIGDNPQIGSYIANQIAAQQMFTTDDLQYRQREALYIDPISSKKKTTNMWLNSSSATNHFHSGDKQLHTKSSRYTIQLGGPLSKWSSGGNDQGLLGITAGLGRAKSSSYSASSIILSLGSVEGYNLGLYNIWYANNKTKLGPYVGLLTQYSFFKNQIKMPGDQVATNYRSYLLTNTLESGYTIQLIEKEKVRFSIQPNMKVSSQRASGLTHQESTGTQITIKENSSIATKLGVRTALEFDVDTSSAKKLQVSPSFEANWKHNRTSEGVWLNHTHVTPQGYRHIAELKLGIESKISNNLQLWANVGQQFGQHKYAETQAIIGGNYHF